MTLPRPCRVLVVDDHPDAAESLARLIEVVGHEARALTDATLVGRAVAQFRPHILMLDIAMPPVDGWTLARTLRQRYAPEVLKMIAITGLDGAEAHVNSRKAGFDAHVAKPIDARLIEKILEQCYA